MAEFIKNDEFEEKLASVDMAGGRRAFIQALGMGGVGAAVFGAAAGTSVEALAAPPNDALVIAVLQFALNLEYLEAAFYYYAAFGSDIPSGDIGSNPGQLTGGQKANLSDGLVKAYALELATEELLHVKFLRKAITALGGTPVDRPTIDIGNAFALVGQGAGITATMPFSPYRSDGDFLIGSYIFEDVGVTAYKGATRFLAQRPAVLEAAAGILAVEAYHAGIIRTALFALRNQTAIDNTQKISDLRSKLANGGKTNVDDRGIGTTSKPTLVPVDGNALAYSRTTDQVLNIVYNDPNGSSQGHTPGLFFPKGMNGTFK